MKDTPENKKILDISVLSVNAIMKFEAAVFSLLSILAVNYYYFSGDYFGNASVINVALFIIFTGVYYKALKVTSAPAKKYGFIFGGILSAALLLGKSVYMDNTLFSVFGSATGFMINIAYLLGFTMLYGSISAVLLDFLDRHKLKLDNGGRWLIFSPDKSTFFLSWVFIFLLYVPCYLSYFPGIFSYDMGSQASQALGAVPYTQMHPVLHTLIFDFCFWLEDLTGVPQGGIIIYSILQMLMLSAVFAYVVYYMSVRKYNNKLILAAFLFFALCPTNAIFSFTTTKDVWFAGAFIMVTLLLMDMCKDAGKFLSNKLNICALVFFMLLCFMFRNNAVYAFILFAPIVIIVFKKHWKRLSACMLSVFILFIVITGPLFNALNMLGGNPKEALSVPMMQIANVVATKNDEITDEEAQEIARFMKYDSLQQTYNPRYADPVKDYFNTDEFIENKGDFLKLWFGLLIKHPSCYVNAFLSLNLPYWYPDATFPDEYANRQYIETYIHNFPIYTFERRSVFPGLLEFYESVGSYEGMRDVPVLSNFFSISTPIWVLVVSCIILLYKKKRRYIVVLLPSLLIWLTFMAGPVSNYRYIYPIFVLFPVFLALVLQPDGMERIKKVKTPDAGEAAAPDGAISKE